MMRTGFGFRRRLWYWSPPPVPMTRRAEVVDRVSNEIGVGGGSRRILANGLGSGEHGDGGGCQNIISQPKRVPQNFDETG